MSKLDVPKVETKTTTDLLKMIAGKQGIGGRITRAPQFKDASAEGEARDELTRRIEVVLRENPSLRDCTFKCENFMRHATADVFTLDVSVTENPNDLKDSYIAMCLERLNSVNNVTPLADEGKFIISLDKDKFENRLVFNEEPAGSYVDESPLTIEQITRPRLYWANKRFDDVVKPHIDLFSTAFKSVREADGEIKIHAKTSRRAGDKLLLAYVDENKPLGFYVKLGETFPTYGVYLHISFEDFKKLLPSTVVDEERATASDAVNNVTGRME